MLKYSHLFSKTVSLVSTDLLSQLHLHPVHGDAPQQGVLLWEQPDEGPDRADAAQLWDAVGTHLHAAAGPLHPTAQSVTGKLPVSVDWTKDYTFVYLSNIFTLCIYFVSFFLSNTLPLLYFMMFLCFSFIIIWIMLFINHNYHPPTHMIFTIVANKWHVSRDKIGNRVKNSFKFSGYLVTEIKGCDALMLCMNGLIKSLRKTHKKQILPAAFG